MRVIQRGFSLLELLVALVLAAVLLGWAVNTYRQQVAEGKRQAVTALLLQNAGFMERYYAQHGRYKASPTSWPPLPQVRYPVSGAADYQLAFGTLPRNTDDGYYVLRATASDAADGYLELTQTGIFKHCTRQGSREQCVLR